MNRPQIKRETLEALLTQHGVSLSLEKVVLVGIRGYFRNSMGRPGQNDVGIFDDALIWITPTEMYAFNGNTDPTREFPHVANLKLGAWKYKPGVHHGMSGNTPYPAFVQAGDVTVLRYVDGKDWNPDTGQFGIHIHHGGAGTSSLGCQTIVLAQWDEFKKLGDHLLEKAGKKEFTYLLVENDGSIA
jgi:hypothetical protein